MPDAGLVEKIIAKVRSGELDPRPAAVALGLPYDQDTIMAILQAALTQSSLPREGDWVTVKFSQEAKSRAYELVEQAAAAAGGYEVTDITILRALNAAAPPFPDRQGEVEALRAANGELRRELSYEGDQRERATKAESERDAAILARTAALDLAAQRDAALQDVVLQRDDFRRQLEEAKDLMDGERLLHTSTEAQLQSQLEEAKGEVERLKNELAHEGEHQRQCAVEWFNKFCAAEAQRDALLRELDRVIVKHEAGENHNAGAYDADCSTCRVLADLRSLCTAHEATAQAGEVKS